VWRSLPDHIRILKDMKDFSDACKLFL
jgi:hypothetical protein